MYLFMCNRDKHDKEYSFDKREFCQHLQDLYLNIFQECM